MRPELLSAFCFNRHGAPASQQTGLRMLSFPTASTEEWEVLAKLGFDKGAYHNHRMKSCHCFPGATTLRRRGTLADLLSSSGN